MASSIVLNRSALRKLSKTRITDARVLFKARRYSGAYYLAGYSVECALKARIAGNTRKHEFPDKDRVVNSYTHDLENLMGIAGLNKKLEGAIKINGALLNNWNVVKDWKETSRYEDKGRQAAEALISATAEPINGVLRWLETN